MNYDFKNKKKKKMALEILIIDKALHRLCNHAKCTPSAFLKSLEVNYRTAAITNKLECYTPVCIKY